MVENSFSVFQGAKNRTFEQTKTLFWQKVLLFFRHIHEKGFLKPVADFFLKTKRKCCKKKSFLACEAFEYWIE